VEGSAPIQHGQCYTVNHHNSALNRIPPFTAAVQPHRRRLYLWGLEGLEPTTYFGLGAHLARSTLSNSHAKLRQLPFYSFCVLDCVSLRYKIKTKNRDRVGGGFAQTLSGGANDAALDLLVVAPSLDLAPPNLPPLDNRRLFHLANKLNQEHCEQANCLIFHVWNSHRQHAARLYQLTMQYDRLCQQQLQASCY